MKRFYTLIRYDWPLHFVLLFTNWLPDNIVFFRLRGFLCSLFLGKCGKDLRIGRNNIFYNPSRIQFGNHIYIAHNNWFCASGTITIDDEVLFGPNNTIVAAGHTLMAGSYRYGAQPALPIHVGKGSWITSQCVITGNTTIGTAVVVAANSVASGNLDDNSTYGGSPAKKIK